MQDQYSVKQSNNPYHNARVAIVGMGVTGCSCARFLLNQDAQLTVFDKKVLSETELLQQLAFSNTEKKTHTNNEIRSKILDEHTDLNGFDFVVLSPGVSAQFKPISNIKNRDVIISDLDIFAQFNTVPCIGVTGSNGKSTVVDLLQRSLQASGKKVQMGGNFGTAALDLLDNEADYIVLELSSFQLDITQKLPLQVACVLNITEDHIDRHHSFEAYSAAKHRIFEQTQLLVVNRDDDNTVPSPFMAQQNNMAKQNSVAASVSASLPTDPSALGQHDFWQDEHGIHCQTSLLIPIAGINSPLAHMMLNMQFVLGIVSALGISLQHAVEQCRQYQGLPHRFEFVAQQGHIRYINDSKATNPGACLAAIQSANQLQMNIILIAGGDAKGADLSVLDHSLRNWVRWCVVYGKDAELFTRFGEHVICFRKAVLEEAA